MYNPLKVNLYLENNLPSHKSIFEQRGGSINVNLINNNEFRYLKADSVVETFIHGASKIESDVELWFEFQNVNNINKEEGMSYMERSNNSISFVIKQLKKYSNVKVKNFKHETMILKLIELDHKPIDIFIEEWKANKEIFQDSIMNINMYGNLYTKDKTFICNYIITNKYENHHSLLKLNYDHTIKYIIKLMLFLEKCKTNNIIYRNFKFSGIGYEFVNSEIQFVVLEYDDITLIKKNDKFFSSKKDGCDTMCAGTLVPYYIIKDFFEMDSEWANKLDKLYSVGLAETLIFLLYTQDEVMDNLFKLMYNPSYLKPCLHYYHFMKLFDDETNKSIFFKLIMSLKPKFVEVDQQILNPMFIRIIQNCFDTKYNAIKSPMSYLQNINKIYSDYNKAKSIIKTFIKPINTINYEDINLQKTTKKIATEYKSTHKKDPESDSNPDPESNSELEYESTLKSKPKFPSIQKIKLINKLEPDDIIGFDKSSDMIYIKPDKQEQSIDEIKKIPLPILTQDSIQDLIKDPIEE